jgi:putative FmdB family regulatory protein
MPTYEYTCTACKHDFERFESITAKPNKLCPKCHKKKAERRISAGGGFLFKGSGFYITDYKKSGSKPAENKENKPAETKAADSKPAAESKTTTPPASTTDSKPASSGTSGDSGGAKSSKSSKPKVA